MTVIPAYGRDYKSAKAARADWAAGKDFIIADFFNPYDGKPVSIRDLTPNDVVHIRYKRLTQITRAQ
jgi:hypothetical protein